MDRCDWLRANTIGKESKSVNTVIDHSNEPWQDNNEEIFRLATGTGPIQTASGVLLQKLFALGNVAADKAYQVPGAMIVCAGNQTERLAEVVGRVTVSATVAGVLQRYPLLERWRVAFFRGRGDGEQTISTASGAHEHRPDCSERQLLDDLPLFDAGDDGMDEQHIARTCDRCTLVL